MLCYHISVGGVAQHGHGGVGKHKPEGGDSDTEDELDGAGNNSGGVGGPGCRKETLDCWGNISHMGNQLEEVDAH